MVNHLAFELVVSVVVFAAVLDLVSTPDAHVLVPVLVHLVSPVVLVLDEIAVVMDPFVILVCVIETRTVVVAVVFSVETVAGRCHTQLFLCTLDSCRTMRYPDISSFDSNDPSWSQPCLERSSGSSPPVSHQHLSRFSLCGCSFAHLKAVAR